MVDASNIIQAAVNSLSEGRALRGLRILLAGLIFALLFAAYAHQRFRGLDSDDAMAHAQLARNLARNRGFLTQCTTPFELDKLRNARGAAPSAARLPELRRAPGYPFVLSAVFKAAKPSFRPPAGGTIFAPERKAIVPLGIGFSLLTILFVFLMARRLWSARVGLLAAALYAVGDSVLALSISGGPLPMAACLTTAAAWLAVCAADADEHGRRGCMFAGFAASALVAGAAALTVYTSLAAAVLLAGFLASRLKRWRVTSFFIYVVIVAAVVSPWLLRNRALCGNLFGTAPYEAFEETFLFPGKTLAASWEPVFRTSLVPAALKAKWSGNLVRLYEVAFLPLGASVLLCLFVAGWVHRFEESPARGLHGWVIAGVVATAGLAALGGSGAGMRMHIWLPLIVLYAAGFFTALTDRVRIEDELKILIECALVVLVAAPAVLNMAMLPPERPYPPYYPPFIARTGGYLAPHEVQCSDVPEASAWYADRTSVLRPRSVDAFMAMHREWRPLSGLLLTTRTSDKRLFGELLSGPYRSWLPLLDGRVPEDFPLRHTVTLPADGAEQIFLTDRPRWPG